ncbi:Glucose-methanol-choline oxidoreductase [Penicillium camemberti]|uniref:Glucose-methanol-choline oxidoreductase n=1 Tax=Penicillium camemberti (strain FM 013) TaxID=1429867 RepID=A0A0G4P2C0_PENC3|nr:Glucose-methanol-choline oxidoreductase [Penicillium camemberti]
MKIFQAGPLAIALSVFTGLASASVFQNHTYDYIVVGGGPSGIISAEKFAKAGKKVLLLERGVGPTVATGNNETLTWDHSLTPIDLPGMSANIGALDVWNQYMCTDTAGNAACVLGGGVTVNYMVFVHPPARDFDDKWPKGWKWKDVESAADRLYKRNPGTTLPSADGKRYDQRLYAVLSKFLGGLGWKSVDMIEQPNEKHQIYSYPSWNVQDQKRAGPVRTYLPDAVKLDNFHLALRTKVIRLVRSGGHVTGVEIQTASGRSEVISVAPHGRVVLAAGALSTPRLLWNSGIGGKTQIETAKKSGVAVPPKAQWIDLPVGVGLMDHPIFPITFNTNASFGLVDYEGVLNGSDSRDISLYRKDSGVLTQGKHRLIFFTSEEIDGHTQYYQGSCAPTDEGVVTITAYMTHGLTSTGVLGLDASGKTVIEKSPYLQTAADRKAARTFIQKMVKDITAPSTGFELETNTNVSAIIKAQTPGTHYTSTAKMGTDDGRKNGTSVVDTNTKVYGVDNLFIVDASIHPDLPTGNIQAAVMVVAEAAAAKILSN